MGEHAWTTPQVQYEPLMPIYTPTPNSSAFMSNYQRIAEIVQAQRELRQGQDDLFDCVAAIAQGLRTLLAANNYDTEHLNSLHRPRRFC